MVITLSVLHSLCFGYWVSLNPIKYLLVSIPITITCMAFSVPAFIHKGGFDVRIGRVDGQVSCRSAFLVAVGIRGEVCADLDAIRLLGLWDSHV